MNRQQAQKTRTWIDRGLLLLLGAVVGAFVLWSQLGGEVQSQQPSAAISEIRWELRRLIQAQEHYYHRRQEQHPDRPAGYASLTALTSPEGTGEPYYGRPTHLTIDSLRASRGKFWVRIRHPDQPVACELEFIHGRFGMEQAIEQADCSSASSLSTTRIGEAP